MALEIEVQGLKDDLTRVRELRTKEEFDEEIHENLKKQLIDLENYYGLQRDELFSQIKQLENLLK